MQKNFLVSLLSISLLILELFTNSLVILHNKTGWLIMRIATYLRWNKFFKLTWIFPNTSTLLRMQFLTICYLITAYFLQFLVVKYCVLFVIKNDLFSLHLGIFGWCILFMIIVLIELNWILELSNIFLGCSRYQKGCRCYYPTLHKLCEFYRCYIFWVHIILW